jgi:DNA primase
MYYSDEVIEEVRARNDIVDVINGYVGLKRKGNSYSACCPFHHEKTPSFHVSREKQMYHCFGCGAGGNVYTFLMEYENFTFPEAVKYLADKAGITLPEREMSEEEKKQQSRKTQMWEVNMSAAAYFHYLLTKSDRGKAGYEYFREKRGLTDETIYRFGLGYADIYQDDLYQYLKKKGYSDGIIRDSGLVDFDERKGAHDKFWNRVMVPILDINGKVIAFGGRVLGDAKPKYLNTRETEIFDKSHNLFAMNLARRSKRRGVILCEGYMDVISMHQAGFDNAIASLGTAFTMGQANLIKRYTSEVYLAYDSDTAGVNATMKAIGILREMGMSQRVIDMRPYKDPDEFIKNLGSEAYEERIRNAISGLMFEIRQMSLGFNVNDPEEKTQFLHSVARKLAQISDIAARNHYIEAVSNQYMLDLDTLKATVTQYGLAGITDTSPAVQQETVHREAGPKKEEGLHTQQRLLLTWMVNHTELFDKLDGIISEEDFTEGEYSTVATALFEQYRTKGSVNPAAIVNIFDDVDKQRLVAGMLQTELQFETTGDEMVHAINDVVKKIKLANIEKELATNRDMSRFQELIRKKQAILKLHISL